MFSLCRRMLIIIYRDKVLKIFNSFDPNTVSTLAFLLEQTENNNVRVRQVISLNIFFASVNSNLF